ncbi:hypothetical protein BDQ12DRAFT_725927 [Crucibulum laeve]|uniref:AMP-dependent synthetase/ligase domain-containing protein n=1 Tax=Crucibulum laeve TaxID=68775 RepID=A0A5C3M3I2_9AGAR|nr:hypothetical protein BDQ12DRAFT_725927 [Crucibulum laeve]
MRVKTNKPGYYSEGSIEDGLVKRPFLGIDTVADIIVYSTRTHGTYPALGWRNIIQVHEEEKVKKKWKYFGLSAYNYLSSVRVKTTVEEIARALMDLGVGKGDVFNVYAQMRLNRQLMAHACTSISATIAAAYDTLGESRPTHSLTPPDSPQRPPAHTKREVHRLRRRTLAEDPGRTARCPGRHQNRIPEPDTLACIMYTSNSTGTPKGVCITHRNLITFVGAVYVLLGHHLTYADSYLAYVPLAHVLEYIVETIMFFVGMPSSYGRVKTLTDASVRGYKRDISEFKPSIMVGVPAVWEQIRKGILSKYAGAGGHCGFGGACGRESCDWWEVEGCAQWRRGGETQEFLSMALVTVLQGYGMTESCGMCAILLSDLMRYDTVGLPIPSVEEKLLDVPNAGCFANPAARGLPAAHSQQGEVYIRGPSVTKEYYKRDGPNPDLTIFTEDDVKKLVKLQISEYITLERLESVYKPITAIILHEQHLCHHLVSNRLAGVNSNAGLADLCEDKKVQAYVLKECNAIEKKNGFNPMELLQVVVLTPDEWTSERGLVTAAQKIQRSKITKAFEAKIKEPAIPAEVKPTSQLFCAGFTSEIVATGILYVSQDSVLRH